MTWMLMSHADFSWLSGKLPAQQIEDKQEILPDSGLESEEKLFHPWGWHSDLASALHA